MKDAKKVKIKLQTLRNLITWGKRSFLMLFRGPSWFFVDNLLIFAFCFEFIISFL